LGMWEDRTVRGVRKSMEAPQRQIRGSRVWKKRR
jgi:hypothetical protein